MPPDSIRTVVVGGGGISAWSAAAALKRHIPSLEVSVVACPVSDDAIADRIMCTLPSIVGFHEDLGLTDADTVIGAKSGLRMGTVFEGWSAGLPSYVHAYGTYGAAVEGVPFHQLWLRARGGEAVARFDQFSAAAELGKLGRIGAAPLAGASIGYGLHLTLDRYAAMMREFALHLGATEHSCGSADTNLRSTDGFIESLTLDDGAIVAGDLFVDCTGPAARIRSVLNSDFEDWSAWLPCDRMIMTESAPAGTASNLDRVTAEPTGWQWEASSPTASSRGYVYSSAHSKEEPAEEARPIHIRQGCRTEPWYRNCVAIGDAAVSVEPLEFANLHLAHSQIDRLVSMMPGRDCAPVELAEYNRQCVDEARRVRDFICMHYLTARRDEPFWKDVASIEPPESLSHTLALFAERGRLPYYEEETFSRDSWTAVLLGQGFEPRGTDPLADSLSDDEIRSELARHVSSIRAFVEAQPAYVDYLSKLSKRGRE
jgi:tryptophan halogenase